MLLKLTPSSVRFPLRVETRPFFKLHWKNRIGRAVTPAGACQEGWKWACSFLPLLARFPARSWLRQNPLPWLSLQLNVELKGGVSERHPLPHPTFPNPGGGDVEISCAGSKLWELLIRFPWCCLILNHPSWHTSHCYCLREVGSG